MRFVENKDRELEVAFGPNLDVPDKSEVICGLSGSGYTDWKISYTHPDPAGAGGATYEKGRLVARDVPIKGKSVTLDCYDALPSNPSAPRWGASRWFSAEGLFCRIPQEPAKELSLHGIPEVYFELTVADETELDDNYLRDRCMSWHQAIQTELVRVMELRLRPSKIVPTPVHWRPDLGSAVSRMPNQQWGVSVHVESCEVDDEMGNCLEACVKPPVSGDALPRFYRATVTGNDLRAVLTAARGLIEQVTN